MADKTRTEVYPAIAESVADARHSAAEFAADAGASGETVEAVRLAVSEAVSNAILHAYASGATVRTSDSPDGRGTTRSTGARSPATGTGARSPATGTGARSAATRVSPACPQIVQVTLAVAGQEMWILVADTGRGHQTIPVAPGLGWGLALIADAADDFVITQRSGGGTEVRMRFSLPGDAGPRPRSPRRQAAWRRQPGADRSGL